MPRSKHVYHIQTQSSNFAVKYCSTFVITGLLHIENHNHIQRSASNFAVKSTAQLKTTMTYKQIYLKSTAQAKPHRFLSADSVSWSVLRVSLHVFHYYVSNYVLSQNYVRLEPKLFMPAHLCCMKETVSSQRCP